MGPGRVRQLLGNNLHFSVCCYSVYFFQASWYELMAIPEHLTDARSSSSAASPLPADPHATPLLWMHVIASWVCAALYLWSLLETTTSTKQQSKAEQYSYSYNANDNNNTSDHCAV